MMTAPTAPADTRTRILLTALRLLNRQGYHATGLKQILDEAAVPKGSFYHYFHSKEELAVELIQHYRQQMLQRWQEQVDVSGADCLNQIQRGLQQVINDYRANPDEQLGCLLASLSGELANTSPQLRGAIVEAIDAVLDRIETELRSAQQLGQIRSDIDAAALAQLFWCSWQGAALRAKVTRNTQPLDDVGQLLLSTLFQPITSPTERIS